MNVDQLRRLEEHYDVLKDPARFMFERDCGMALSFEIIEYEFEQALNEIGIASGQFAIPTAYKNLCCLHDGFSVRWQFLTVLEKGHALMGNVKFSATYDFIMQNVVREGKRFFLFDDVLDKWKVYIELTQDPDFHKLHFANLYEAAFFPMTISASQYFQKAALCRGLTYWHEFFLEDISYAKEEGNRMRFRKQLETLFSDVRFEDFINVAP